MYFNVVFTVLHFYMFTMIMVFKFRLGLLSLQQAWLYKWEICPLTSPQVIWVESQILILL